MKYIDIEITEEQLTETKEEYEGRIGKWLKDIRKEEHPKESLEEIASKAGISVEAILRCESGKDILDYDLTKLLEYYDPDHSSCMLLMHNVK